MSQTIRIIGTTDFLSSVEPCATSYGGLPGADGLRRVVEALREGRESLWVDSGDFSTLSPLAALSGGRLGFHAASELGIDAAAIGNHELDYGLEHFHEQAARLPFPVLAANFALGLPSSVLLETGAGPVGVIGLTLPELGSVRGVEPVPDVDAVVVRREAAELRANGARAVVAALHEGVHWQLEGTAAMRCDLFESVVGGWIDQVDAIVAGHTLGRWIGRVRGVPVVQPWAWGSEVGVIDLDLADGSSRVSAEHVRPGAPWTGAGADLLQEAKNSRLGRLPRPLASSPARAEVAEVIAKALLDQDEDVDAVGLPGYVGSNQPIVDGVIAYVPAEVTEFDVLRLMPTESHPRAVGHDGADSTELSLHAAEISASELEAISTAWHAPSRGAIDPRKWWAAWPYPPAIATRRGRPTQRLLVQAHFCPVVDTWIGRDADWEPTGRTVAGALRQLLAEGARSGIGD